MTESSLQRAGTNRAGDRTASQTGTGRTGRACSLQLGARTPPLAEGPPQPAPHRRGVGGDSGIFSHRRHRRLLSGDFKLLSPTLLLAIAGTWKFPHGIATEGRSEL